MILKKIHFTLIFFALNILLFGGASAQTLNMNQFGVEQGLPQSSIACIEQDLEGNIWIGTLSGVAKYNGLRFENFSRKNGLTEYRVVSSTLDKHGNIWFGHYSGGLTFYNHTTKRFSGLGKNNDAINSYISALETDKSGNVWIGTQANGLFVYKPTAEELNDKYSDSLKGSITQVIIPIKASINAIKTLKNGKILIATSKGIYEFESTSSSARSLNAKWGLQNLNYTAIEQSKKDEIWIGSESAGIFVIKNDRVTKNYGVSQGLGDLTITCLMEDAYNNVFVGTKDAGMFKYLRPLEENHYTGYIFQSIGVSQGLSNNRVTDILQDRENNIWVGTALNLNQYFDEQFEIFGTREGLLNSLIWSIAQDKKDRYWFGTDGGLYTFIKGENPNKFTFENVGSKDGIRGNVTSLYVDENGNVWFTANKNGIYAYSPETKNVTNYSLKDGLASNDVNCITGNGKGNIYIGTNGGGLSILNTSTKKVSNYSVADGLGASKIYSMLYDSKGRLWLGTLGGPLTIYENNKFKTYGDKEGYENKFSISLTEDLKGNIWIGSFEKGIFKYDGSKFTNYTVGLKTGMSSDQIFLLVCDNKDRLWIGNNLGIDRMDLKTETFRHYSRYDGFLGVEINPNAVCKDKEGNLWFGSIIGAVKYNSPKEKINQAEPFTSLKTPRLFFKEMEQEPEDRVFKYNQNHLTFDFIGASLTNPMRVHYRYMLEGIDTGWSPPVSQNFVTYPDLQPGSYTFKVIASNNDGVWNKEPITYQFKIKPPFWKTWWFYTICLALIIAGVRWYFIYQQKALMEQNKVLEQKVTERTEELRKEKEIVEKQNINIHDSIDYASRIQNAVFVPKTILNKLLPNHFVFFKPKDKVSGDFYWAHEKNGKVFFAVSDCTGHGVPGALITIIGCNMLDKIMNTTSAATPSEILGLLSKEVANTLETHDEENKLKDGMDISMCAYDAKTKTLEFAAAYNSMYLVKGDELTEYKADKIAIGKSNTDANAKFKNHTIQLTGGETIYLFTDGYPDQIGGPKRTKFFYPPFRKLLTDLSKQPLPSQSQQLDKTIVDWLGAREQIDDLCIMGIKIG